MMYPELEGEIRRQEEEIARQVRDQVLESLYQKALIADQKEQEGTEGKAGDPKGGSETATSLPLPLYPELGTRTGEEEGKDGSATPVADLENWPRGKDVLACNRHMLENQLVCDVWFRVGREGEGEGAGERVGAHAYVLRSRSSAFYAMLERRGEKQGEGVREDITLTPDTSPKVLWQLLRYLYYEDLQLDSDTVLELLELANSYDVLALKDACLQFLRGILAVETVCSILEKAHAYNDKQLTEACLRFIPKHGSEVIESSGLVKLCRECLNRVLTLDGLEITPTQRQETADRWASHRCQDPDLPEVDKHKHLGDVMYVKKDTAQSRCYFSDSPKRFDKHNNKLPKHSPTISPFTAGSQLRQINRFRQIGRGSVTNTGSPDAITFSVDYPIYLYGFGIYGPSSTHNEEASYRVDTALSRKNDDIVLESISIKGVGAILPVMLEKPVKLKEDKKYTLAVYVQGPPSQCGTSGKVRVSDGQVIFTFFKPSRKVKGNRTDIVTGQIPRLYYLPC